MVTGPEVHEHQAPILLHAKKAESQSHKQPQHAQADMQMHVSVFIAPGQTHTKQGHKKS